MRGGCRCGNIRLSWQLVDYSLVPRQCDCEFCRSRELVWVSKQGAPLDIDVMVPEHYAVVHQGTGRVDFHHCTRCKQIPVATSVIDHQYYAVVNVACLHDRAVFAPPRPVDLTSATMDESIARRRANWCSQVTLRIR